MDCVPWGCSNFQAVLQEDHQAFFNMQRWLLHLWNHKPLHVVVQDFNPHTPGSRLSPVTSPQAFSLSLSWLDSSTPSWPAFTPPCSSCIHCGKLRCFPSVGHSWHVHACKQLQPKRSSSPNTQNSCDEHTEEVQSTQAPIQGLMDNGKELNTQEELSKFASNFYQGLCYNADPMRSQWPWRCRWPERNAGRASSRPRSPRIWTRNLRRPFH